MTKEAGTPKKETAVEKVTLRNRDVRGVQLIKKDGTAVFVGPKAKVTMQKEEVSAAIRRQVTLGVVSQEE